MVKKLHKSESSANAKTTGEPLKASVRDSAQQIWQAGLGAFAKAQAEGTRAFESLVKEGSTLQRKTQAAAEEKLSEATSKMSNMASDITSKASGHWDKLENIFEERVAKALGKLGVPSAKDVSVMQAHIDALNRSVDQLSRKPGTPAKAVAKRARSVVVKPAAKQTEKSPGKAAARPAAKASHGKARAVTGSAPKTAAKPGVKRIASRKAT